jgi:hypothetical protein
LDEPIPEGQWLESSITGLQAAFGRKELSSLELARFYIQRIQALD